MRRLLVTGADGFVGRHLVRKAVSRGWQVSAAIVPGGAEPAAWLDPALLPAVETVHADLLAPDAARHLAAIDATAVVHLAALSSGAQARRDPAGAMAVNRDATIALGAALLEAGRVQRLLFVSTAEVYGAGHEDPIAEGASPAPVSPYAESKLEAERALAELAALGLPLVVARPFPHSGPGQDSRFVLPAFAERLRDARRSGATHIPVGNLDVVRDFVDVRDVVAAYLALLDLPGAGGCYNVATGQGQRLRDAFQALAQLLDVDAVPTVDAALVRPADIPMLVGDPSRLRAATGWSPTIPFARTLKDLVDAQAD